MTVGYVAARSEFGPMPGKVAAGGSWKPGSRIVAKQPQVVRACNIG